ncbi:MAG: rhodanese-like domain-containing protein [Pseudomonadales bacterium]
MKTAAQIVSETKEFIRTCTPEEAIKRVKASRQHIVVDVREPVEYEKQHIKGSINVPRGVLEWKISSVCSDVDAPITVHCASGGRAVLAAKSMVDMGYRDVTAVDGSFEDLSVAAQEAD